MWTHGSLRHKYLKSDLNFNCSRGLVIRIIAPLTEVTVGDDTNFRQTFVQPRMAVRYLQTVVPIFVEHWGDNLQFYPNFALFSTLGGINLDHDFVQVWKFSEDQKKKRSSSKIEQFFPQIQVKTKKKRSSTKIPHFFPQFSLRCTPIQIIGGNTAKSLGGYIPPLFQNPYLQNLRTVLRTSHL